MKIASITVSRTIQVKAYEPLSVSLTVEDIDEDLEVALDAIVLTLDARMAMLIEKLRRSDNAPGTF